MRYDLENVLPDEISDETAYELVAIFERLVSALEYKYQVQIRRYVYQLLPLGIPQSIQRDAEKNGF